MCLFIFRSSSPYVVLILLKLSIISRYFKLYKRSEQIETKKQAKLNTIFFFFLKKLLKTLVVRYRLTSIRCVQFIFLHIGKS